MKTWHINQVIMLTLVTASTAYGFGATLQNTVLTACCAFFLALGGFHFDNFADRAKNKKSGKKTNPIASGKWNRAFALGTVIASLALGAVTGFLIHPAILIPVLLVILTLAGLATGLLETPFLRSASLGLLQGLYGLIGAFSAGRFGWGIWPMFFIPLFRDDRRQGPGRHSRPALR